MTSSISDISATAENTLQLAEALSSSSTGRRRTLDTFSESEIENQLFPENRKHQRLTKASMDEFGTRVAQYLGLAPPKVVHEEEDEAFEEWEEFIVSFAKAYLVFKGTNSAKVTIQQENHGKAISCYCSFDHLRHVQLNMFFWSVIKEKEQFMYCTKCSTLPVALIEVGMFPLSNKEDPSGAVHFSVCDYFDKMKKAFNGSGKQTADFYNSLQHGENKPLLSPGNCTNIMILYRRMMEVSGQWPSTHEESEEE